MFTVEVTSTTPTLLGRYPVVGVPITGLTFDEATTISGIIAATMRGYHGAIKEQPELRTVK